MVCSKQQHFIMYEAYRTRVARAPVESLLSFAMNMLSRKNEYEADDYANSLGYNQSLQRGLVKIHIEVKLLRRRTTCLILFLHQNLGNLCVDKWYSAYHSSHPSLVERLQALVAKARKHD
jgi:STE24 endopeptidase